MTKGICVVFLLIFLIGCTAQPPQTNPINRTTNAGNYIYGIYEISLTATCVENNSVGNDWHKLYTYDGIVIENGQRVTALLDAHSSISIDITITEADILPDIGNGNISIQLKDGATASTEITVFENRGPYTGNTAQWQIECNLKLVEKTKNRPAGGFFNFLYAQNLCLPITLIRGRLQIQELVAVAGLK